MRYGESEMTAPVNVGEVLAGKYQVERVLGAGGMGVVVAARHLQLDERVALKFLLPDALKEPGVVARFEREGRAAAKIKSEHVARVRDVGTLETGAPFLVMEYLDGSDLSAVVKAHGPLPVATAVEYVLQACEAIAEAHAAGIVHRDLKPANLFVTARADGSPVVKVLDFGISKVTVGIDAGMDITKTAEMRGSILFMPPEQMARPREADPRCDIWALGVSLYNLLTGAYPFRAGTVPELCAKVFNNEPDSPRAYRAEVPTGLEGAILRCLRKEPSQRFASVAELSAALVPFAGPEGRVSADRISRTLGGGRASHASSSQIDLGELGATGAALGGATVGAPSPSANTPAASVTWAAGGAAAPAGVARDGGSSPRVVLQAPTVTPSSAVQPSPGRKTSVPAVTAAPAVTAGVQRVTAPLSSGGFPEGTSATQTAQSTWGATTPIAAGAPSRGRRPDRVFVIASVAGVVAVLVITGVVFFTQGSSGEGDVAAAASAAALQTAVVPAVRVEPPPGTSVSVSPAAPEGSAEVAGSDVAPAPDASSAKESGKTKPASSAKPVSATTGKSAKDGAAGAASPAAPATKPKPAKGLFDSPL